MKNNEVFNEIRRTATEWETAKRERSERKKAIIKEFGYDSPEYAAWSESDTETPFPISHGAMKAYHAWRSNNENDTEEFEFNDFTWETETKDFIAQRCLRTFTPTLPKAARSKDFAQSKEKRSGERTKKFRGSGSE